MQSRWATRSWSWLLTSAARARSGSPVVQFSKAGAWKKQRPRTPFVRVAAGLAEVMAAVVVAIAAVIDEVTAVVIVAAARNVDNPDVYSSMVVNRRIMFGCHAQYFLEGAF